VKQVTVRPAEVADHTRIGDLTVAAYAAAGQLVEGYGYDTTLRAVTHRAEHATILVAELDGAVVGSVSIIDPDGEYAEIEGGPEELEFRMLAVDPDLQGAGVGTALLEAVLAEALRHKKSRVVLATMRDNARAQGLYERRGFDRQPERDFEPGDGVDLIVMALELPRHCPHCGTAVSGSSDPHDCGRGGDLEPPRYCPLCARRLVVQVLPTGWTARCSRHGSLTPTP
jgi:ribosomal protein S18 acetylase RimI-like enzyme